MDQQAFQIDFVQGVWVFAIFVCKRNVYKVMSGQARSLHSSIRSLSTQMSGEVSLSCPFNFLGGRPNKPDSSIVYSRPVEEISEQRGNPGDQHQHWKRAGGGGSPDGGDQLKALIINQPLIRNNNNTAHMELTKVLMSTMFIQKNALLILNVWKG